jgi:hypothetical protein
VAAVKSLPVHLIKDVIFSILEDRSARHYCNVYVFYVLFLVSSIWPFSTWVVPVFLLEYCLITLGICCLLFKLSFYVLSVICRLHNLRSPFQIRSYLVPPIVFRLGHTYLFTSNLYQFVLNVEFCFKPVLGGLDGNLHSSVPSMNRLNQTEHAIFSICRVEAS